MATQNPKRKCSVPEKKRLRENTSSDSDSDLSDCSTPLAASSTWPRFLLVKSLDPQSPVSKLSPFAIAKAIQGLAGEPKQVQKLRSGDLLVEVVKKAHSDNLLRSSSFAGVPVKVEAHTSLNTSKGIIKSKELVDCTEEELLSNLSAQGVKEVKRFTFRREGTVRPSYSILLTFSTPTLPEYITAAYLRVKVEPFIPSPLRCFRCQAFGHHRDRCNHSVRCGRCAAEHEGDNCQATPHCVNCGGSHPSFSRDCPQWQHEREIQRVRVTQRVSFPEARRLVNARAGTPSGRTYSSVVQAKQTVTVGCQTDLSCLTGPFPDAGSCSASTAVQTASERELAGPSASKKTPTPKPPPPRPAPKDAPPQPHSRKANKNSNRLNPKQQEEWTEVTHSVRPNVKKK